MEGSDVHSGIPCGELLSELVESTLANDQNQLTRIRSGIVDEMGTDALVDSAAIIGNFQRMVRIADGTGIPLDKPVAMLSAELRDELGFDRFGSAELTPRVGFFGKLFGRVLGPIMVKRLAKNRG